MSATKCKTFVIQWSFLACVASLWQTIIVGICYEIQDEKILHPKNHTYPTCPRKKSSET